MSSKKCNKHFTLFLKLLVPKGKIDFIKLNRIFVQEEIFLVSLDIKHIIFCFYIKIQTCNFKVFYFGLGDITFSQE